MTDLFSSLEPSPPDESPGSKATNSPPSVSRESRFLGTVLGAAIGDALGHPTEFICSFEAIEERYGPGGVRTFELYREEGGKRFAPFTDDTQMAEVVLRTLLDGHGDLDDAMTRMAAGFVEWSHNPKGGHRAPGNSCMAGCRRLAQGVHWSEGGGETAGGCGSVMRAYPFGLIFADDVSQAEKWAVEHSKLTHRDPIALAAAAAMAAGIARIIQEQDVQQVVSEMVAACCRYSLRTAKMMIDAIEDAQNGIEPRETLQWLEGWAAHEAISAAVYVFVRHPDDFAAAVLEGANTPGDSDSIATLAGALVGARLGIDAIPKDWIRDVERSEELAGLAKRIGQT